MDRPCACRPGRPSKEGGSGWWSQMPRLGAKALRITYSTLGFGLPNLEGGFGRPLFYSATCLRHESRAESLGQNVLEGLAMQGAMWQPHSSSIAVCRLRCGKSILEPATGHESPTRPVCEKRALRGSFGNNYKCRLGAISRARQNRRFVGTFTTKRRRPAR